MISINQIFGALLFMDIHFSVSEIFAGLLVLGGIIGAYVNMHSSIKEIKNDLVWIKKALDIKPEDEK